MKSILLLLVLISAPAQAWAPPTLAERAITEQALRYSYGVRPDNRDPFLLLEVLRLETHPDIRVPEEFRGMSLAISYREARWSSGTIGDGGLSRGWAQMHPAHWRRCNKFERSSPVGSMRCILWRMRTTYDRKTYRRCRRQARLKALRSDPVTGKRNPAYSETTVQRNAWITSWRWIMSGKLPRSCEPGEPRLHLSQLRCWSHGERHSGVCKGRRGGWRGALARYRAGRVGYAPWL